MYKVGIPALVGYLGLAALLAFVLWPSDLEKVRSARKDQDFEKALKLLKPMAADGGAEAQFQLGRMFELGEGVEKSMAGAARWYNKAASQGHARAQYYLANTFVREDGTVTDDAVCISWYRRAAEGGETQALDQLTRLAEKGHVKAQMVLADFFVSGRVVPKAPAEAAKWYRQAASAGEERADQKIKDLAQSGLAGAQFQLGEMYLLGDGVVRSDTEALRWYTLAAEQGHRLSQYHLGRIYMEGPDDIRDSGRAGEWFSRAAGQGHARAQYLLGLMYESGRGMKHSETAAVELYVRAEKNGVKEAAGKIMALAETGNTQAQFHLAEMYYAGRNVKADYTQAAVWYRRAAVQGHAGAQYNLGYLYAEGQGVPFDDDEARLWFDRAMNSGSLIAAKKIREMAQRGNAEAQYRLGLWYIKGNQIPEEREKNLEDLAGLVVKAGQAVVKKAVALVSDETPEGLDWLSKAASQGHSQAQFTLGESFAAGRIVPRNKKQALYWYHKAAALGHPEARKRIHDL